MSKSRGSPRKFSEKIALLNKKEVEATAEFEKILKEVGETTRAPPQQMPSLHRGHHLHHFDQHQESKQYYGLPQRSSSFSNWQRCAPQLHAPFQSPQPQQYLTQPVQYNSNQMDQLQSAAQASVYVNQQQQQQQQQQRPYINQTAQQQHQQQHHHHHQTELLQQRHQQQQQQQQVPVQQRQQLTYNNLDLNQDSNMRPASLGVPNIEIFRIDDDQGYQQVNQTISPNTFTDGPFRHSCSNSSPISSARSLPNIANLSVSSTAKCFMNQMSPDQRLLPSVTTTAATTTTTSASPTSVDQLSVKPIVTSDHQNESYVTNDYCSNDEYCSLPAIQEPVCSIDPNDPNINRQSQTGMPRNNSWQTVMTSSAPCSAAPTPPPNSVHGSNGFDNGNQQQSPQHLLHQDYYPAQQLQSQGQMIRASSTNVIDKYQTNDLLEAPQMDNNNLSKSSEAYYGYLDDYVVGDCSDYSNNGHSGDGENFGNVVMSADDQSMQSPMRAVFGTEMENINIPNDCKQQNHCIDTNQQQSLDASQYSFYG